MGFETNNHIIKPKQFFGFLVQTRLFKFEYIPFVKMLILVVGSIIFSSFTDKTSILSKQQEIQVKQIATILNPSERAVNWLLYTYQTSLSHPQSLSQQLTIAKSLWPDNFQDKKAILLLTKAEIAKIKGEYEHITRIVLAAIQQLESNQNPSINQKKILSFAYIAFARFSKYSREKEGLNYAYKGLELATSINFTIGKVFAHNQIGLLIGYFKKDYKSALIHFTQAKNLLPQLPPTVNQFISGFIIGNIAKAWSDLGDIEKSIAYKLKVLEKDNHNLEILLGTHNNLGSNYYALKQYDLAEKHLQKTIDLIREHQVYTNMGIPMLRMGLIQLERGNIINATHYADSIDFWLINHKFIGNYQVSFYQFKSKIAKAKKNYKQAVSWIEKASMEQDSIDKIARFNNLEAWEESSKLKEIKQEKLLLVKELAANKAIINKQYLLLFAISFAAILSIWFSIFSYRKTRKLKKAYNSLPPKNNSLPPVEASVKKIKNSKVKIPKEINQALKQKILYALDVEKIYLSPDLTLKKFADQLSSNTSYVSQTINEGCGRNFSTLINEYRIEEVVRFFAEGQHKQFTIESLYKKAGFKSKSAFQKAFKSSKGVTASYYLDNLSTKLQDNEKQKTSSK